MFDLLTAGENYKKNRNTLSSRLSEAMFGSLLAAFILGFISYPGVVGFISYPNDVETPYFNNLLKLTRGLAISFTYTIYTSFFYITYQQIIFNMQINRKHSSHDFLVALSLGFAFGLSLYLQPFTLVLMIACMTLASWRARYLLKKYHESLVEKIKSRLKREKVLGKILNRLIEQGKIDEGDSIDDRIKKSLSQNFAYRSSENSILEQWRWRPWHQAFLYWSLGALVIVGAVSVYGAFGPASYREVAPFIEIAVLAATAIFFSWFLRRRLEDMPDAETASDRLDSALATALERVRDELVSLAQDGQ